MASNLLARRAGVLVAGTGLYVGVVYGTYSYLTAGANEQTAILSELQNQQTHHHHSEHGDECSCFSFTNNPSRNHRYQEIANVYDEQIGRDEFFMGINLLRRCMFFFHAKGTVLEVGAGTGRNLSYYPQQSVDRVLLTDVSDQMLLQAREKIRNMTNEGQRQRFACLEADAQNLDFPDGYFDTVVDTFGLCSYNDPVRVLRELSRVCKPDGKILLLEHGRSKTWESITKYLDRHAERHAKNWGCVWNRDLDALVENAGLEVERLDTWHFGTTYYIICRPKRTE